MLKLVFVLNYKKGNLSETCKSFCIISRALNQLQDRGLTLRADFKKCKKCIYVDPLIQRCQTLKLIASCQTASLHMFFYF